MNIKAVLATAALSVAFVPGVQAGVLLPNLYAREYCSFRRMGVSVEESMTAATNASYVDNGETAVKVTIGGEQYDADVVRAIRTARERCPQY